MNQNSLEQALANLPLGKIEYFDSITSTNDLAAEWAASDAPDLSLVVADEQTKGRGRAGRKWHTPPNSAIAMSVLLRPNPANSFLSSTNAISLYTGLGAVAVCRALENSYELNPTIKWPNDILLDGGKLCGILTESHWLGDQLSGVVIGIGINIASTSIPEADLLDYRAVCLEDAAGKSVNRSELIKHILTEMISLRSSETAESFIEKWNQRLAYRNEKVMINKDSKAEFEATILGLDSQGGLILELENGEKSIVQFEEIQIRPFVDSSAN